MRLGDLERRLSAPLPEPAAPASLRARIEGSLAGVEPGRQRVAGRSVPAWGVAGVTCLLVGCAVALPWAMGRGRAVAPPVAHVAPPPEPPPAGGGEGRWASVQVSNPLATEATRLWSDVQRLRAGLEGPWRVLSEAGRSL